MALYPRVVLVEEQEQAVLVHRIGLGEGQRAPHEPRHPLAQDVVEALDVAGLALAFARRPVLLLGQHFCVGRPEVRVEQARPVGLRDALPEQAAGGFAPTADDVGDDLARPAALGEPDPALVPAPPDERPEFIEFQRVSLLGSDQRLGERRERPGFFLATR